MRALALLAGLLATSPAKASCQLALLLALDVSSSVDGREYQLQRDGLAAALLSPEVQGLLFASGQHWVALAVYEWSGRYQPDVVLDWTLLKGPGVLTRAAGQIAAAERSYDEYPTAMGYALGFGATLLKTAPDCARRTIDVSGDGIKNEGFALKLAYGTFPLRGVTVNGLVIAGAAPEVRDYYLRDVIRGAGAFVEIADDYDTFEQAMRRKLVREIGVAVVGSLPQTPGGG